MDLIRAETTCSAPRRPCRRGSRSAGGPPRPPQCHCAALAMLGRDLERGQGPAGVSGRPAAMKSSASSSTLGAAGPARPRARGGGAGARAPRRAARAPSAPAVRESRAEFTSKEGFSVVAPTRTTVPFSTGGRRASCWALLKRWISSRKKSVRSAVDSSRCWARSIIARTSARPAHGRRSSKAARAWTASSRARVVFPVPGGPYRISECGRPCSIAVRKGSRGRQVLLADELPERPRPHASGERLAGHVRGIGRRAAAPPSRTGVPPP